MDYVSYLIEKNIKAKKYTHIEMQDYLRTEAKIEISEKQDIFKMRSRMIDINKNMKRKRMNFECDACKKIGKIKKETQKHVFKCKQLNNHNKYITNINYKDIFGKNIEKIKQVITRMNENLITRKKT